MRFSKPRRIHIAGPYGSGKSTLAKEISKILDIPIYELDELKYDRRNKSERTEKEMETLLKKIISKKSWIVEGAWSDRARASFKKADLVIILNPSRKSLFYNHFKRIVTKQKNFTLKFNLKLLKKSLAYSSMTKHPSLHSHVKEVDRTKDYLIIKNLKETNSLINKLKGQI